MTNFDFLQSNPQFATFSHVAASSEMILNIDASASVLNCRRAMELAVKWMYAVDEDLILPEDAILINLMTTPSFRTVVDDDMYRRMDFVRRAGNIAAHSQKALSIEQATLCLENLFYFLDFVAYCYDDDHEEGSFDAALLELTTEEALSFVTEETIDIDALLAENKALKEELTQRRILYRQDYVPKPLDLSVSETRKVYIETLLEEAKYPREEGETDALDLRALLEDFAL